MGSTQQARKRKHDSFVGDQQDQQHSAGRKGDSQAQQPEQLRQPQEKLGQQRYSQVAAPSAPLEHHQPQPQSQSQSQAQLAPSHQQQQEQQHQLPSMRQITLPPPPPPPPTSGLPPAPQTSTLPSAAIYQASSPSTSISSALSRPSRDVRSLSFIMHPSHEDRLCEEPPIQSMVTAECNMGEQSNLDSACYALGLALEDVQTLVDEFFDTFPSFQLFHRPTFWDKLQQIQSINELNALLAAILIFAFSDQEASHDPCLASAAARISLDSTKDLSQHFGNLAEQFAEQAMHEYAEQGVPLPLLQAMILINHWLLIRSVRGKSWRYLGVCVRCAYELNLHTVDKGRQPHDRIEDVEQWSEDEEKRRAWWAIWEMDVFASVVRRCPTGIDWSYNETFLPAPDKNWFENEPQESCCLEPSIVDRWKKLRASGNKSHKAWFLVVNSLVKDAQNVSQWAEVDTNKTSEQSRHSKYCSPSQVQLEQARRAREARDGYNKVSTLHNVLQCIVEMMPTELRYQNQFLSFSPRDSESPTTTTRLLHQEIYSMHMVVQYARLMIYKFFIFRGQMSWGHLEAELAKYKEHAEGGLAPQRQFGSTAPNNAARQCFVLYLQASQNVVNIIQRTQSNHYKFVNPFLANTIWLATAVQILKRELLHADTSERELSASNAELLRMTYLQFESYWGISNMLERNLSALEVELNNIRESSRRTKSTERDLELSPQPPAPPRSSHGAKPSTTGAHHWRGPGMAVSHPRVTQAPPVSDNGTFAQTFMPPASARVNALEHTDNEVSRDSTNGVHRNDNAAATMPQRLPNPGNGQSSLPNPKGPQQGAANYGSNTAVVPERQSPAYHLQTSRSLEQDPFLTSMPNEITISNSPAFFDSFFSLSDGQPFMDGVGELSGTLDGMLSGPFM